jgi:lysophospholipase L1-like esterase
MRRPTIIISALLLILVMAAPASAATPTGLYVALGDSLAVGDGASDWDASAYVPLMADYYAGTPHADAKHHVNLGVQGETTASFLGTQVAQAVGAILDPVTDTRVVTLSIGGNDVGSLLNDPGDACVVNPFSAECQGAVATALSTVAQNYPTIIGTLQWALAQDEGDDEPIYVLTVFNPFGGTGTPYEGPIDIALQGADLAVDCTNLANPANAGLNDIIACTSLALGAIPVDGYGAIGDNALTLTHIGEGDFNTHPNDAGYAAIAKAHRLVVGSN